ncbi:hypothetical protein [Bartonella koehlerae]|nr:hypothetical protein [Bartonella koehlerae]
MVSFLRGHCLLVFSVVKSERDNGSESGAKGVLKEQEGLPMR